MTNVLESGFEFMDANNPNGSPKIKGYNIINGKLQSASNGETFESRNPALLADCLGEFPLSTKDDVHQALNAARDAFSFMVSYTSTYKGADHWKYGQITYAIQR
jgi:hypothetical protein